MFVVCSQTNDNNKWRQFILPTAFSPHAVCRGIIEVYTMNPYMINTQTLTFLFAIEDGLVDVGQNLPQSSPKHPQFGLITSAIYAFTLMTSAIYVFVWWRQQSMRSFDDVSNLCVRMMTSAIYAFVWWRQQSMRSNWRVSKRYWFISKAIQWCVIVPAKHV